MPQKEHLTTRLEQELLDRLGKVAAANRATIPNTICLALDALERQEYFDERMDTMEESIAELAEMMAKLDRKMDEDSNNEKERLKSLYILLEGKLKIHDDAEQERFERLKPRTF